MAKYWCRYFDRREELVKAERLIAVDNEKAIATARRTAPIGTLRFELWRNVNFVHAENVAARRAAESAYHPARPTDWMIGATLSGIARLGAR